MEAFIPHWTSNTTHDVLLDLLSTESITTLFQPIVSLADATILGYEALSRGPIDSPLYYPNQLFDAAKSYDKTFELELLCRKKAIEHAKDLPTHNFLFLNVDPYIFKDERFKEGLTKELLQCSQLSPHSIIFEITEKTAVEDYASFHTALAHYVGQGYKIAIDDMGSGYSGLKMLAETRPHFVKIDMDLVRNIDTDHFKQALLECFVKLAKLTNMKLIAEGIETREELKTLIQLGIDAGQGFLLGKPQLAFKTLHPDIHSFILSCKNTVGTTPFLSEHYIGEIVQPCEAVPSHTTCQQIKDYLQTHAVSGVPIVEHGFPIGLIMANRLDAKLATPYGVSIFSKRAIALLMDTSPLVVDYYTPVIQVARLAMSRDAQKIYDYVIVTKNNSYFGLISIKALIDYKTEVEYAYARQLNPLSGLPGNDMIQQTLLRLFSTPFNGCVLYCDLDHFKVYNDLYGFENGDHMLRFLSKTLQSTLNDAIANQYFLGHIGGDDFICILHAPLPLCQSICQQIISSFDQGVQSFFDATHLEQKYITSLNRSGISQRFPLTSLSIAGTYGSIANLHSPENFSKKIASIKQQVKAIRGSAIHIEELSS